MRKQRQTHISVGNLNLDISLRVPSIPAPEENVRAKDLWIGLGGAATNYAIAVSKLGHKSYLVARVGREAERLGFLKRLVEVGVDISYINLVDEPIGIVIVLLTKEQDKWYRSMITLRGANEKLSPEMIPDGIGEDVLHFGSVAAKIVIESRSNTKIVSYDPGGESFKDPKGVLEAFKNVNIVFLNEKEFLSIFGNKDVECATSIISGRLKFIVVKLGSKGAIVVDSSGIASKVSEPKVESPVDVTGAGDAFDAAFNIYYLESGGDVNVALRYAAAAGAAKVLKKGSSSMPTLAEIKRFLQIHN